MASNPCNPAMSLPTQGYLGTCHTVITVEWKQGRKKGGVVGGKKKNKKSTNTENNLEEKGCTTLFPMWF